MDWIKNITSMAQNMGMNSGMIKLVTDMTNGNITDILLICENNHEHKIGNDVMKYVTMMQQGQKPMCGECNTPFDNVMLLLKDGTRIGAADYLK